MIPKHSPKRRISYALSERLIERIQQAGIDYNARSDSAVVEAAVTKALDDWERERKKFKKAKEGSR